MMEITTVIASTMIASTIDRLKEPTKSPDRCCTTSALNQWRDTPFIGNVRPPVGPWKDRMKIADMGPYRNNTNSVKNAASA